MTIDMVKSTASPEAAFMRQCEEAERTGEPFVIEVPPEREEAVNALFGFDD